MIKSTFKTIIQEVKINFFQDIKELHCAPQATSERKQLIILSFQVVILVQHLLVFVMFMCSNSPQFRMIVPAHWNMYKSHLIPKMTCNDYQNAVQYFRTNNQLKEGFDWIDQRQIPEYPLVYAPKDIVCSYNPQLEYCSHLLINNKQNYSYEAPNVVIIVIESFCPSPMMIDDQVVESQQQIITGHLYKELYLPNLRSLSEKGVSFASLSSNGMPTIFGWHSLMTGEIPYSDSVNMVQSQYNDVDDLPSFYHQQDYHTMYVSPSEFRFDGKHNWVYRGRQLIKKDPGNLKGMPLWFDDLYYYFPDKDQATKLELEESTFKCWIPDRITSTEFIYHFNKTKQSQQKPVFGVLATVDTHMPFRGFDDSKFYDPYTFGDGVRNRTDAGKINRYATVAKYADHYIGNVINFLTKNYNNTILLVMGDHAARESPIFKNEPVDPKDPDSVIYDDSCNGQPFVNDQQFTTTAVLAYLGDNEAVKEKFAPVLQKVVKVPTDHQDVVRTLFDFAEDYSGKKHASSRNGRNLLEIATNLTSNMELRKHLSIRTSSLTSEVATEDTLYRYHTLGPYGQKFNGIYPTCVTGERRNQVTKQQYNEFSRHQRLYEYLQRHNKQFSYKFRDQSCIYPNLCEFPVNMKAYNGNEVAKFVLFVMQFGLYVGLIIIVVVSLLLKKSTNKQQTQSVVLLQ
ncbi:Sulfatase [Hexamita inflata]|uniref:Sulfatase n=1 Tax=Hexamita inflata TaxID=28002 RepID=A0AA86RD33_9EUKA|nr:Sulfatase [Hexamita inflata]